ncbi:MAG: hypothetical protein HY921_05465 [Elusimicrobia bacterium]|nr:hypothetical protein [Elusimicrobiota bacterium]
MRLVFALLGSIGLFSATARAAGPAPAARALIPPKPAALWRPLEMKIPSPGKRNTLSFLDQASTPRDSTALAAGLEAMYDASRTAPLILDSQGDFCSGGGFHSGFGGGSAGGRGGPGGGGFGGPPDRSGGSEPGASPGEPNDGSRFFWLSPADMIANGSRLILPDRAPARTPRQASAAPTEGIEKISLKPVLEALSIEDMDWGGIPLRSARDIALTPGEAQASNYHRRMPSNTYPIEKFAADSSGEFLALSFHQAVVPKDSQADRGAVVVKIEDGAPRIAHVIKPGNGWNRVSGLRFVPGPFLRVEGFNPAKDSHRYSLSYEFLNPATGARSKLGDYLPFEHVVTARAFSDHFYLVVHDEAGQTRHSLVYFDPRERAAGVLPLLNSDEAGLRHFLHNVVDERDVWSRGDSSVWVRATVHIQQHPHQASWILKITSQGASLEEDEVGPGVVSHAYRVEGAPTLVSRRRDSTVSLHEIASDRLVQEWTLKGTAKESVWGTLRKAPGGYVAQGGNHPYYGFYLLKDDGTIEALTPAKLRLIHFDAYPGLITGVGNLKRENYSVDFYRIRY